VDPEHGHDAILRSLCGFPYGDVQAGRPDAKESVFACSICGCRAALRTTYRRCGAESRTLTAPRVERGRGWTCPALRSLTLSLPAWAGVMCQSLSEPFFGRCSVVARQVCALTAPARLLTCNRQSQWPFDHCRLCVSFGVMCFGQLCVT
jgi:hypothetical protein